MAKHIEYELKHGLWSHCAIYEDELQRLWPLDAPYRELRIAAFAAKYGFRLRFYNKGKGAIFDRQPDDDEAERSQSRHRMISDGA